MYLSYDLMAIAEGYLLMFFPYVDDERIRVAYHNRFATRFDCQRRSKVSILGTEDHFRAGPPYMRQFLRGLVFLDDIFIHV